MINVVNDVRLITKVCTLYYIDNINQKSIAELLGLSRPTISRMINNGRKLGIVEITINDRFADNYAVLEKELEDCLNLKEVRVVADGANQKEQQELNAKACAEILERLIRPESKVGVTMGETLYEVEKHLSALHLEKSLFIPLIGECATINSKFQATAIAERLARHVGGNSLHLYAPARVRIESIRDAILQEGSIRKDLNEARQIDIALLEPISFDERLPEFSTELFHIKELKELKSRKAVGEICYQFFDKHGSHSRFKNLNTTIGININTLRRVKSSISIFNRNTNVETIIGAARGQYINILILPETKAHELIDYLIKG